MPLRFAADHRMESLRDKSGTADVRLVEVKEKILPDLDDEFAKSLDGTFETLEAVRAAARKQLEAQREVVDRRGLEEKVLDAVLSRGSIPLRRVYRVSPCGASDRRGRPGPKAPPA